MAALHKMASANVWIFVIVVTLLSSYPVSCLGNNLPLCPAEYQCTCTAENNNYEVECSFTENSSVSVHYVNDYAYVQCNNMVAADFNKLPSIVIPTHHDAIKSFSFRSCPLPQVPLKDVMVELGLPKGSENLKIVIFQSQGRNLSKSLSRYHFQGLESITRLVFTGTGITELPEDIFADLKNLTWLDLKSNSIILKPGTFAHLSQLSILELGHNKLSQLPEGLFKHLSKLTQLNLWQNNLHNLSGNVFDGLQSLEKLDLSINDMSSLSPDIFHKLPKLAVVNLLSNNFSSLPTDLFKNNPNLEFLGLLNNKQVLHELPSGLLSNLTKMKTVSFTRSQIEKINDSVFWNSMNLQNISFEGNYIKEIQYNLFRDQMYLENLNFEMNKISKIEDGAFRTLKKLKTLNLNNNRLQVISPQTFKNLASLEKLWIKNNNLQEIAFGAFSYTPKLQSLDLSYNSLTLMQTSDVSDMLKKDVYSLRSPFQEIEDLRYLNLSHNLISEIFNDWKYTSLHLNTLDLSYNKFIKISYQDLNFLSPRIVVDVTHNDISVIDFKSAEYDFQDETSSSRQITVKVDENPLACDCLIYPFALYMENRLDRLSNTIDMKIDNLKCASPTNMKDRSFSSVRSHELLCLLDIPESNITKCPANCNTCSIRPFDRSLIMNCSDAKSKSSPDIPNVNELKLKQTELHYENNNMMSLEFLIRDSESYNQITRLFVGGNNISTLSTHEIPKAIEILDLRKNNLEYVNSTVAEYFDNITSLSELWISKNPFKCNCENRAFFLFLQLNSAKVKDIRNITCSDGRKIESLKLGEICDTSSLLIILSVTFAITGLFLGITFGLYYKYHLEIKVWLYAKNIWIGQEPDDDKLYDAFISYSHKDEEFITKTIVPRLEDSDNYKLCLHYRNWVPGEFIPTQIASSVEQSRRTLVVLSPNFLESVWGRMEFRTAHQRALKEGRARVIVILYGDIGPSDNLDPELKAYLSMNTYVKWGDPWFWDKLVYALPHRKKMRTHTPAQAMLKKKGFDDKLELIHPTTPGTPPGQNTPPAHQAHTNPLMNHVNSYPNGINGMKPINMTNGTITMNGLRVNGNARHSDV